MVVTFQHFLQVEVKVMIYCLNLSSQMLSFTFDTLQIILYTQILFYFLSVISKYSFCDKKHYIHQ